MFFFLGGGECCRKKGGVEGLVLTLCDQKGFHVVVVFYFFER